MNRNLTNDTLVNAGIFIIRAGLGMMFILHGFPKLIGGAEVWEKTGNALAAVGIAFYPVAWGLLAALTEFAGGILLILGILFRPACILLLVVMIVAVLMHYMSGEGFMGYAHALEDAIVFLGLSLTGPGTISLAGKFKRKKPLY